MQPLRMRSVRNAVRGIREHLKLSAMARRERRRDSQGLPTLDLGLEPTVRAAVDWLARARDRSTSRDGGVAHHYCLVNGWITSYPESTGYVVPTLLEFAARYRNAAIRQRARQCSIGCVRFSYPRARFQAGLIDSRPVVPSTFNTGQILLGLVAGTREFGARYVHRVVLPRRGRPARHPPPRGRWYHRALRWRTGCEGRISATKRCHGLRRCRYRDLPGMERWVGLGAIASNLRVLARAGPRRQPRSR